jgi:hypothetical protein
MVKPVKSSQLIVTSNALGKVTHEGAELSVGLIVTVMSPVQPFASITV